MSPDAPPKILVERYLIEIARNYNVPYEADASVMLVSALNTIFANMYSFCKPCTL